MMLQLSHIMYVALGGIFPPLCFVLWLIGIPIRPLAWSFIAGGTACVLWVSVIALVSDVRNVEATLWLVFILVTCSAAAVPLLLYGLVLFDRYRKSRSVLPILVSALAGMILLIDGAVLLAGALRHGLRFTM